VNAKIPVTLLIHINLRWMKRRVADYLHKLTKTLHRPADSGGGKCQVTDALSAGLYADLAFIFTRGDQRR